MFPKRALSLAGLGLLTALGGVAFGSFSVGGFAAGGIALGAARFGLLEEVGFAQVFVAGLIATVGVAIGGVAAVAAWIAAVKARSPRRG